MRIDQAAFEARVRLRAGNPSVIDVVPAMLTEAVDAALREYGKYRGPQTMQMMRTVAERQDYLLDEAFARVEEIVWGDDVDVRGDIFLRSGAFSPFESLAGLDTFQSPSLLNIVYQQMEDFRVQFEGKWELYDAPTGNRMWMRISPPPWTAQNMLVIGRGLATIESVPEKDAELLMDACLWKLNEMRVESLGQVGLGSISFGGGSVNFGTQTVAESAKKYEDKFLASIGANAPQFGKG